LFLYSEIEGIIESISKNNFIDHTFGPKTYILEVDIRSVSHYPSISQDEIYNTDSHDSEYCKTTHPTNTTQEMFITEEDMRTNEIFVTGQTITGEVRDVGSFDRINLRLFSGYTLKDNINDYNKNEQSNTKNYSFTIITVVAVLGFLLLWKLRIKKS